MINVDTIEYFKSAIAKPINPLQRRFYMDALLALEKQIPLQVGDIHGDYEPDYDCMICGEITNYEHQKYCIRCGQRLGW